MKKQFESYMEAECAAKKLVRQKMNYYGLGFSMMQAIRNGDKTTPKVWEEIGLVAEQSYHEAFQLTMRHWINLGYVKDCILSRRFMAGIDQYKWGGYSILNS